MDVGLARMASAETVTGRDFLDHVPLTAIRNEAAIPRSRWDPGGGV
jgi:hypothetical protein